MAINFNQNPYWDDYDETKGFLKILYRPGYAVQARELTQSQDILQNQISRFGSFVFKSGSQVLGGQITLDTNVTYANINPLYQNTAINITQFANTIITDAATRTTRASVVAVQPQLAGSQNPPTLMLKYLTGTTFANGANITVESSNSGPFALIANGNSQGTGSIASLQDGVFFIDLRNITAIANANANNVSTLTNGYFVRVPKQTIVLDTYDNTPTFRVGLQISDTIVTEQVDASLLDPALGSTNAQAPGAARYLINAILSTRAINSTDDTAFIELLRVQNGTLTSLQKYPVLSDLNKTLAQRTFETSGNFTVTPFSIQLLDTANNDIANANTQQYNVVLNAGLAYVQGYRNQTISKTVLPAPKARTFVNVANYGIHTYYGNYLLVDTVNGEFNISTLPLLDLHCVNWSNVNTITTQAYANTLIGTARLRAFEYASASNTANGLTYVFRAHMFDINTGSITGVSTGAGAATITFPALFNAADNAYLGMVITIPTTGDQRIITTYNGANKIATVSSNWSVPPTANTFTLIGDVRSTESLGLNTNSSFITANANINIGSKNQFSAFQNVSITDSNFQPVVFPFPNSTIAQGLQTPSYEYRYKVATGQTLQAGTPLVINLSVPGDASATFASAGISNSDLTTLTDFLLVRNPGGGVAGNIIPMVASLGRSVTATSTTATFTMNASDPTLNNIDIYASINTTIGPKTKTFVAANTNIWAPSGGVSVGPATVYLAQGQISFATPATSNLTTPGLAQDLYISDGQALVCVVDSGALGTSVTSAMIAAAANNGPMPTGSLNITNNYTLFGGQKDTYYDHATLTLKPGAPAPIGQIGVLISYFSHSTTGGYFTVDSYPNYTTIPTYQLTTGSGLFQLRDVVDFRPRRDDATTAYTFANSGTILLPEPSPTGTFIVSFAYYLGRVDKVILTKNGTFKIIQGTSSLNPSPPPTSPKSMLLYTLTVPPYTFYAANVFPIITDNRRYTMADIGVLDKRIQALEYYTALNSLEQQASAQNIVDNNGLTRPKNGILVDNFQGSSVADVSNPDYFAAIDSQNQQMRPPFSVNNVNLIFNPGLSSTYQQNGKIFTLPYSTTSMVNQGVASRTENLNPFNLTVWNGTMKLDPESDTWISTTQAPSVVTNLTGTNDNFAAMGAAAISTQWNDWQTIWSGVNTNTTISQGPAYKGALVSGSYTGSPDPGQIAYQVLQNQVTTTTSQLIQNQTRTGVQTTVSYDAITKLVGTNVINVSIIPTMRTNVLKFIARSMKPFTQVYPFFDNVLMTQYVLNASVITFTSNVAFQDIYQGQETLVDTDGGTNGGFGANSADVLLVKGNRVYVKNIIGVIYPGKTFQGSITGNTGVVQSFQHNSGATGEQAGQRYQTLPFTAGVTALANSNTIVLAGSAANTDNYYTGNVICIASGDGIGAASTITAYNGASRIATVSPAWNVTLTSPTTENFYYQIGTLQTDINGDLAGQFVIPSTPSLHFPTGTSVFMLSDSTFGNVATASTKAQDSYTAQGTLETTQEQFVTTRVPVISTQTVQQTQTVVSDPITNQTITTSLVGYVDPLAQTFLVDNIQYPDGVFITSVRVCFFSIDNHVPVTLQIRPTTNGYPDSGVIMPLSEVILPPSKIKTTLTPSLDDSNQYTEFTFDAPLHLLPGTEYAIVLLSNSNQYTIYTASVGDKILGSDRLISQPPYLGVLFKSQNSSTWTPFQGESLMFRVNKAVFTTNTPMFLTFNAPPNVSNTPLPVMSNTEFYMDVMYLINQDQVPKDTTVGYAYRATSNTSRTIDATYTSIIPAQNFFFTNREVITPAGNAFFLQTTGSTTVSDVSPIIDAERYGLLGISEIINNGGIQNNNITITNPGKGYNIANTNIVTVSGGNGAGAQLQIGAVDANGNITSIIVSPGGAGSAYTGQANGSITTSGYSPAINATFAIASEVNPSGGNFVSRYITRMVTLAPGMDAGDLNVTFNAHKPAGTQIYVYYKILSAEDTTPFKNRPYTLMSLQGTDAFASGTNDFTSYTYVGSLDAFGNPVRKINYGTYTNFKYFAIKIVMASNNPTVIPLLQNLAVTAMPATN